MKCPENQNAVILRNMWEGESKISKITVTYFMDEPSLEKKKSHYARLRGVEPFRSFSISKS